MNNEATMDKMQKMKLHGMLRAFNQGLEQGLVNKVSPDELLGHLIDAEWDDRHNRRLKRLIKAAKFRYRASLPEIDFELKRDLDKAVLLRFSDCGWIRKRQDIIITGPTGVGKSFLASALGYQGCMYGFKVLYFNSTKLFSQLKLAHADGSYVKELNRIGKQDVLILDDFGLNP
ncbi:MAG: ATP-binding protein, partial [Candidatus Hydrothermarchaeales archaeon]